MLKRHRKVETFVYDDAEERDLKALQYGGGIGVKKLDIFGDKEEFEDDEYLLEIEYYIVGCDEFED